MSSKSEVVVPLKDGLFISSRKGKRAYLLLDQDKGAENFCMVVSECDPGAVDKPTMMTHDVEQAIFVISGTMEFTIGDKKYNIGADNAVYIPPGTSHGYTNIGNNKVKFVSIYAPQGPEKDLKRFAK